MEIIRVEELPETGLIGALYIVEPGTVCYIWDVVTDDWLVYEQRAPYIQNEKVFFTKRA